MCGGRARVFQWLFFEQYSHEPFIATVRFWVHAGQADEKREEIETRMPRGYEALGVMEGHLAANDFFVAGRYSIADIALYAYTHVCDEGGFDLAPYPAVRAWLERVRAGAARGHGGTSLSLLEPHKLWQNSFTVLQKRGDGWAEPVLTQNP